MGLLKGIATAVLEKTKDEVKEYLQKLMEEEKKRKEAQKEEEKAEAPVEEEVEEAVEEVEEDAEEEEEAEEDLLEDILPIVDEEIERLTYKSKPDRIMISYELADLAQQLPLEEFSLYIKMVMFSQDQKKNYGYLGNSLKKKLGLEDMDAEDFNMLAAKLEAYGLLQVETVSDNQRTYIVYLPFDDELMKRTVAATKKKVHESRQNKKPDNRSKKSGNRNKKTHPPKKKETRRQEDEIPGKVGLDMKDEDLYKSYRTFVNLEIDKAKMRVGRSNFDKIYMEAVKYIDKKYGFKVLSDSDKFKEYLTNYYISAFDIKTFDQWKKDKA